MRSIRVYDASRQPRDWSEIIQPGQFVVFASLLDGGDPCDVDGVPTSHGDATCAITDSLAEAAALSRDRVAKHPAVRFDIFDAAGRSRPPLLTVVHPDRAGRLEGSAGSRRRNRRIAIALLASVPLLIWVEWHFEGAMVLPGLLAFNLLLFAMRLLMIDAGYAAAERRRTERAADRQQLPPR